jgi:hypothetical protein
MKKLGFLAATASLLWMTLHPSIPVQAAKANTFQPKSGGYTITIPPGSEEIYHTSTGIRFKVGQDFMVSADLYALPSFISVPMKQYSSEQKKELDKFLAKIQDDQDGTIEQIGAGEAAGGSALDRLRQRAEGKSTQTAPADKETSRKPKRVINDKSYEFRAKPNDPAKTNRPYIIGKAYQPQKNSLLVVTVRTTDENADAAGQALKAMTQNMKLGRVRYPDINLLTVPKEHYSIEIPSGWRVFTVRADNVIFARSLSSVHTDNLMIREFSDDSFRELGNASKDTIAQAETNFINKITQYTPNITILKHEPITVGDLRGSLFESTDNEDLKKAFILNAYLLNPQGKGYMLHFQTDDTINYDLKLRAFRQAVESFTLLKDEENTTAAD